MSFSNARAAVLVAARRRVTALSVLPGGAVLEVAGAAEDEEYVHVDGAASVGPAEDEAPARLLGVAAGFPAAHAAPANAASSAAPPSATAPSLSVAACQQVSTMLNRRGRVLTSFSLVHHLNAHSNWDAPLVEILGEGGMAALLELRPGGNTDRLFCMWLLSMLDPVTMKLDLGAGRIREINVMEVKRILGLVSGGGRRRVLRRMSLTNRAEVLERVHEILGTETSRTASISILRLRAILQAARTEPLTPAVRRKIKAAYAMLAFSTFLAPQEPYPKVADEILYYVQYPDEMMNLMCVST